MNIMGRWAIVIAGLGTSLFATPAFADGPVPYVPLAAGNAWRLSCGDGSTLDVNVSAYGSAGDFKVVYTRKAPGAPINLMYFSIPSHSRTQVLQVDLEGNDANGNTLLKGFFHEDSLTQIPSVIVVPANPQAGFDVQVPQADGGFSERRFVGTALNNSVIFQDIFSNGSQEEWFARGVGITHLAFWQAGGAQVDCNSVSAVVNNPPPIAMASPIPSPSPPVSLEAVSPTSTMSSSAAWKFAVRATPQPPPPSNPTPHPHQAEPHRAKDSAVRVSQAAVALDENGFPAHSVTYCPNSNGALRESEAVVGSAFNPVIAAEFGKAMEHLKASYIECRDNDLNNRNIADASWASYYAAKASFMASGAFRIAGMLNYMADGLDAAELNQWALLHTSDSELLSNITDLNALINCGLGHC